MLITCDEENFLNVKCFGQQVYHTDHRLSSGETCTSPPTRIFLASAALSIPSLGELNSLRADCEL